MVRGDVGNSLKSHNQPKVRKETQIRGPGPKRYGVMTFQIPMACIHGQIDRADVNLYLSQFGRVQSFPVKFKRLELEKSCF